MKKVTVKYVRNHEHIFKGKEFNNEYDPEFEINLIKDDITNAIHDFENFHNSNGWEISELDEYIQEEVEQLRELRKGSYSLDTGDYTYYITIE